VAILTLSRGARGGDQAQRARESAAAADVIGARLYLDDLEDSRIAGPAASAARTLLRMWHGAFSAGIGS
jgi:hypothetical protein